MDEAMIVSLLQQIVDGLSSVEQSVDRVGELLETNTSWIGERLEEQRMAIIECRERLDTEGSHVQDRLNEIKRALAELPADIGSYMN